MKEKYVIYRFIKQNFASFILSTTLCTENISIYYTALCKQAKCGDQDVIVVAEEVALDDDDAAAAAAADDEDMYMHIAT